MHGVRPARVAGGTPAPGRSVGTLDDVTETATRIVRTKSIPNVDTARLIEDAGRLCAIYHGAALVEYDGPRREMIDNGRKMVAIARELARRGEPYRCCGVVRRVVP